MATDIFFCYNFPDHDLVYYYYNTLARYTDISIYCYGNVVHTDQWEEEVYKAIENSHFFILFIGKNLGETQKKEYKILQNLVNIVPGRYKLIKIYLDREVDKRFSFSDDLSSNGVFNNYNGLNDVKETMHIISEIVINHLNMQFDYGDDLPSDPHLFDYEKNIIDFFIRKAQIYSEPIGNIDILPESKINEKLAALSISQKEIQNRLNTNVNSPDNLSLNAKKELLQSIIHDIEKKIKNGCPSSWPVLQPANTTGLYSNPLTGIGEFRDNEASVLAAALSSYHKCPEKFCLMAKKLAFLEAGPRKNLYFPKYSPNTNNVFRVAVLVSGGIAPGINAVIDGITQRHYSYKKPNEQIEIWGLKNGFQAFDNITANTIYLLNNEESRNSEKKPDIVTSDHINEGGSIIGTSRDEKMVTQGQRITRLEEIVNDLKRHSIRILYIIGGDGSMKAAHAISYIVKKLASDKWDLSVVAIPKTMDNDILWVWQTFGFLSAVEKAREFVDNLAVEIKSNPRLGIVQLFGSDSGFVVSHTVLASRTGICDIALIPEVPFSIKKIGEALAEKIKRKKYGLVVMAETAIPTDAINYIPYPDTLPDFEKSFYEKNIKGNTKITQLPLINKIYGQGIDAKYYSYDRKTISKAEEEYVIQSLHEAQIFKYINFDQLELYKDEIIHSLGETKYLQIFDSTSSGSINNLTMRNQLLNSFGYFHFIDIHLNDDEINAIKEFIKLRNKEKRIEGQTNDHLRTAGLKIITRGIKKLNIDVINNIRVVTNEPRHLLRAIPPSTIDIIFGNRLGTLAVDNAMAGYSDFMISQWLTEYVLVPLKLVVLGRKRIPPDGFFWRSVLEKTKQEVN
jgi:6-phosphofructokinase